MTQELAQHHITYLQDQFKILYYAVDNISTDKKFGDTQQFLIKELKEKNGNYAKDAIQTDKNMNMMMSERDQFRDETKELLASKLKLANEALVNNMTNKEKIGRLEI